MVDNKDKDFKFDDLFWPFDLTKFIRQPRQVYTVSPLSL